jgi:hypothetical protein
MITLPFQQQFTWRKLGYQYLTNSLDYRSILELNPRWEVTELPPLGAQVFLPDPNTTSGSLQQSSFISGTPTEDSLDAIYPFNTTEDYITSLNKYTVQGVVLREKFNGYSFDSNVAATGVQ